MSALYPRTVTAGLTALRVRLAEVAPPVLEVSVPPSWDDDRLPSGTEPTCPGRNRYRSGALALLGEGQEATAARYLESKGAPYVASLAFQAVSL